MYHRLYLKLLETWYNFIIFILFPGKLSTAWFELSVKRSVIVIRNLFICGVGSQEKVS